jgi:peroxidase
LGLIVDPAAKFDPNVVDALQNRLFEGRLADGTIVSVDLVATNINRGRDHGIPSYNSLREKCGLRRARTFEDLRDVMTEDKIKAFSSIYK